MRKRKLLLTGFLLLLSAGLLARAPSGFPGKAPGQDQPEKPKFYALGVVCEKNVQNAKDSLAAPDGRYAEILPGGQFIVLMKKKIYPFPFIGGEPGGGYGQPDSGTVVGKGGADFSLEGWLPIQDTQDKQHCAWTPLGLSVSGFCLPTYCTGMDMIKITNPGSKSLFVDAMIGYGREARGHLP